VNIINVIDISRIIQVRLYKEKVLYKINSTWAPIGRYDGLIAKNKVMLNFGTKQRPEKIELDVPLQVDNTLAYMFGLFLGSGLRRNYELSVIVGINQLMEIKNFCRQYGLGVDYELMSRPRKKVGADRPKKYVFKRYVVKVPPIIYKYLKCLGLDLFHPKLPDYLEPSLKRAVLSGYLNSKKTIFVQVSNNPVREKIVISTDSARSRVDFAKKLAKEFHAILLESGITPYIKHNKYHSELTILRKDILHLVDSFGIKKSHIFFRASLIKLCTQHPHLGTFLDRLNFDSYKMNVASIVFHYLYVAKLSQIPFTRLEDELSITNNDIRMALYELQEQRLISYFKNDVNKDFIAPKSHGFFQLQEELGVEVKNAKKALTNIYFRCSDCNQVSEYLKLANSADSFRCPGCGCTHLLELSTFNKKYIVTKRENLLAQYKESLSNFHGSLRF
jgi:transcription initiation factor IIE alpha subunit